jgi:hypothetical protein
MSYTPALGESTDTDLIRAWFGLAGGMRYILTSEMYTILTL